jgi:hypothetical protein
MSFGKRPPGAAASRRRAKRHKTDAPGEIIVPGLPSRPCRVVEISDVGARLELTSTFGVPEDFELRAVGRIFSSRIVRRYNRILFVEFS